MEEELPEPDDDGQGQALLLTAIFLVGMACLILATWTRFTPCMQTHPPKTAVTESASISDVSGDTSPEFSEN